MAFILFSPQTEAATICDPTTINNHYKGIYCGIQQNDSESFDEDLITILSNQFGLDEDYIEAILGDTICSTIKKYSEEDKAELPQAIQDTCLPSGKNTGQVLGSWSVFTDIKNTYQKEKKIQQSSKSLAFKFKTSEVYWDGKVGPGPFDIITDLTDTFPDPPFDLVVDLNLIEIVLFGSNAEWMDDVFSFPSEEEEGAGGGQAPLDELLPEEDESKDDNKGIEDTGDPGLTVTEEGGGALPPDCVLPDDPEADIGDGPGSGYDNPLCGNGTVDILMAEQCDDGNTQSGDGCNQYCQTEASGSNNQCIDPDAITFKRPEDTTGLNGSKAGGNEDGPECPPGSVPKMGVGIQGQEAGPPKEIPQSPEYPGPFLGGTLKQFGESNKPPCPEGYSDARTSDEGASASASGSETVGINIHGEQYDIPRCLPTEFCADFKDAQDFLFGEGWENDENLMNIAPAIEALFCVNIIKENRPQSPYNMNEGCVDCHIIAMVDALEKALATNVSPLKNTTSAFGISSPYGPNFSFNLNTATKSKLKFNYTGTAANAIRRANETMAKSQSDNTPLVLTVKTPEAPLVNLTRTVIKNETAKEAILEEIRLSSISNGVISDQEVGGRIKSLLEQWRDSFATIQAKFEGIIGSTGLDQKKQCK